jgi:hypothetical protein
MDQITSLEMAQKQAFFSPRRITRRQSKAATDRDSRPRGRVQSVVSGLSLPQRSKISGLLFASTRR